MNASAWQLRRMAQLLWDGGVIAYPTEGVYGLGCDPQNRAAVFEILRLKQRPVEKGLILIAANWQDLAAYVQPALPQSMIRRMRDSWPGPNTWVVPAHGDTPGWLTGYRDSIAVRVTAHPLVRQLCNGFGGALVSTSANPGGRPPATTALKARSYFPGQLDAVLEGPLLGRSGATGIRDAMSGRVLR